MEAVVLDAAQDLIELLEGFQPEALERHVAVLPNDSMRSYLRMSVVRVVRLVELLRRRGFEGGEVLEVGCLVRILRPRPSSARLRRRRVRPVLELRRCVRQQHRADAGRGDPHRLDQPRERARSDRGARPVRHRAGRRSHRACSPHAQAFPRDAVRRRPTRGPPPTRYAERRSVLEPAGARERRDRLSADRGSVPLRAAVGRTPSRVHRRESSDGCSSDIGCEEVEVEFLDYNMLQFEELSAEHIECLATIVEDPSQSDTLLAAGRRPVEMNLPPQSSPEVRGLLTDDVPERRAPSALSDHEPLQIQPESARVVA